MPLRSKMSFSLNWETVGRNLFTSTHVKRSLDRKQYWYLRYQGMNIRRDARRAVRAGTGTAPQPGSATKGGGGLALIYYMFDRETRSVIVGPIGFESQPWREKTVPEVLEYGGYVTPRPGYGTWSPTYIPEHPYMRPALVKNLTVEKRQKVWDSVNRKV